MPQSLRPDLALPGDRYSLAEVIGRGGMAVVYRGTDQLLKRPVAVKVLRQPDLDPSDRQRFLAEARTLAALSHPGLVTLLDVYSDDDCTFLVMELVEGSPLSELSDSSTLEESRVAEIGGQLAEVLSYVHGQGVVHRDVKPENVLVDRAGRVRLTDFGIARVQGEMTRHTATGAVMGTAAYVAPEQITDGDITGATDIYAMGLVLLERLTGAPAFEGTPAEVCLARLNTSPHVPATLPAPWRLLLSQMTARQPATRPSAAVVRERLNAFGRVASAPAEQATQVLDVKATRPLTIPIATADDTTSLTKPIGELPPTEPKIERWRKVTAGALNTVVQMSPRTKFACLAALILFAVVLVAGVVIATGDDAASRGNTPDVPGKIGRDLQSLHEAVTP